MTNMTEMTKMWKQMIFGPLSSDYCTYFYIFSLLHLIAFTILLITFLVSFFAKAKSAPTVRYVMGIWLVTHFVVYFHNRLLYNMCRGALP